MSLYSKLSNPWRGTGNSGFEAKLGRMLGLSGGSAGKESACNAGDPSSISGLGRSSGEEKGNSFQYSGLEKSMDYTVHGVTKGWTRLSDFHFTSPFVLQASITFLASLTSIFEASF